MYMKHCIGLLKEYLWSRAHFTKHLKLKPKKIKKTIMRASIIIPALFEEKAGIM